jgi:hypothetical protein
MENNHDDRGMIMYRVRINNIATYRGWNRNVWKENRTDRCSD